MLKSIGEIEMFDELSLQICKLFSEPGQRLRFSEVSEKLYPSKRTSQKSSQNVKILRRLQKLVALGLLKKEVAGHKKVYYTATSTLIDELKRRRVHQRLDGILNAKSEKEIKKQLKDLQRLISLALSEHGLPLLSCVDTIKKSGSFISLEKIDGSQASAESA